MFFESCKCVPRILKATSLPSPVFTNQLNALPLLPMLTFYSNSAESCSYRSEQLETSVEPVRLCSSWPLDMLVSFPCCAERCVPEACDDETLFKMEPILFERGLNITTICTVDACIALTLQMVTKGWSDLAKVTQPAKRWLHWIDFIWIAMPDGHHQTHYLCAKACPDFKQKPISENKNGWGERKTRKSLWSDFIKTIHHQDSLNSKFSWCVQKKGS